jgi:hypothetical protein
MVGLAACCSLWLPLAAQAAKAAPVAAWRLDEGAGQIAADDSGNGNGGVLGTTTAVEAADPAWVPGRLGQALRFVGERNQFVTVKPGPGLRPQRLTVQAFVRRQGTPGRWRYVVSMGGLACDRSSYGLYSGADGGISFYVSDATRYVLSPAVAQADVWDGAWHLVTGTYDGARVGLYLDGVRVGTGTPTTLRVSYSLPAQDLLIGSYHAGCDLPFTGDIDEVRVWGAALTPVQIRTEDTAVADRPPPADGLPPVSGPPAGSPRVTAPGSPALVRCFTVRPSSRKIRARRRARITVRVAQGTRPVARAVVRFRGPGVKLSRVTNRAGKVVVRVTPRTRGKLRISVRGQPLRCTGAVVTAR